MTTLERISITDIERKINSYGNLFQHRTATLEAVRKIAYRNLIHMETSRRYCYYENGDNSFERVQAKMLSDQGLEDDKFNRLILGWTTYYPLSLYLSLLYAEIEFYEIVKNTDNEFADDALDSYLNQNRQFVDTLEGFRHGFLHPSKGSLQTENEFLQAGNSYLTAPVLQYVFDNYLVNLRTKLDRLLFAKLVTLPEFQKLYCIEKSLNMSLHRIVGHKDLVSIERLIGKFDELSRMKKSLPDAEQNWKPNLHQENIANRIARSLDILNSSIYELEIIQPVKLVTIDSLVIEPQTPLNANILNVLVDQVNQFRIKKSSEEQDINPTDSGKHLIHLRNNLPGYVRLLMTGVILMNESICGKQHLICPNFFQKTFPLSKEEFTVLFEEYFGNYTFQRINESSALGRVVLALLHEPLRVYNMASKDDPSLKNDKIDEFISSGELKSLKLHRDSILHIAIPSKKPFQDDFMNATTQLEDQNTFEFFFDVIFEFLDLLQAKVQYNMYLQI